MSDTKILEAYRKHHFWRGVRSACIVLVPIIIVLLITLNVAIDALLK